MARFTKPKITSKLLRRKVSKVANEDFGTAGKPVNTSHPFYFGFMVTIGALLALTMLQALASASAVFILIMGLIIGMPYPGPLAMVVLICGFIPLVGHFIGMSIVTVVSLTDSLTTALIALGAYIVYVQIENYVITPKIMRKSLAIPGLVTIIAALLGASLLGLIGGLLAVPIAAAVLLILDEVVFPRADQA